MIYLLGSQNLAVPANVCLSTPSIPKWDYISPLLPTSSEASFKRRPIYSGPGCQTLFLPDSQKHWSSKHHHGEILEYLFIWCLRYTRCDKISWPFHLSSYNFLAFLYLFIGSEKLWFFYFFNAFKEVEKSQLFYFFKIKSLYFWPKVDMCRNSKDGGRNIRSDGTKKNSATAENKDTYLPYVYYKFLVISLTSIY